MKPTRRDEIDETRADIARRRLAQLAAAFDAELPPPEDAAPAPRRRIETSHVRVVATIGVAASVLLVWWLLAGRPHSSDPVAPLAFASSATPDVAGASSAAPELIVDVVGKVNQPGIVTVPKGSRVFEAIEAAGGLKGRVDVTGINMARELTDGEQVLVGIDPVAVPGAAAPAGGAPGGAPPGAKVNLNTATAEQLDLLPGVGPVTAQAILGWRQTNGRFASVDDLLDVKGIGEATLAELRDLVVV